MSIVLTSEVIRRNDSIVEESIAFGLVNYERLGDERSTMKNHIGNTSWFRKHGSLQKPRFAYSRGIFERRNLHVEVNNEFPEKVLLGTAQLFRAKSVVTWVNKEAADKEIFLEWFKCVLFFSPRVDG